MDSPLRSKFLQFRTPDFNEKNYSVQKKLSHVLVQFCTRMTIGGEGLNSPTGVWRRGPGPVDGGRLHKLQLLSGGEVGVHPVQCPRADAQGGGANGFRVRAFLNDLGGVQPPATGTQLRDAHQISLTRIFYRWSMGRETPSLTPHDQGFTGKKGGGREVL